jgi:hypothetical protein
MRSGNRRWAGLFVAVAEPFLGGMPDTKVTPLWAPTLNPLIVCLFLNIGLGWLGAFD